MAANTTTSAPTKDETIAALGAEMSKAAAIINALHGKTKEVDKTSKPKPEVLEKVAKELVTAGVIKAPYEAELVKVLSDHNSTLDFLSNLATTRKEAADASLDSIGRGVNTASNSEDDSFHKDVLAVYSRRRTR